MKGPARWGLLAPILMTALTLSTVRRDSAGPAAAEQNSRLSPSAELAPHTHTTTAALQGLPVVRGRRALAQESAPAVVTPAPAPAPDGAAPVPAPGPAELLEVAVDRGAQLVYYTVGSVGFNYDSTRSGMERGVQTPHQPSKPEYNADGRRTPYQQAQGDGT